MTPFGSLPRAAKLFIVGVIVSGVAAVGFGWAVDPVSADKVPTLLYLAVGTQIAETLEEIEASTMEWVQVFAARTEVAVPLTRPVSYPPPSGAAWGGGR